LAGSGANIALNGFGDPKEIEKLRESLASEFGTGVIYVRADMAKPSEIATLIEVTERDFGAIDILINNAGIQHVEAIETFPIEKWDQILAINLSSAFHSIRGVIGGMKARGFGRIINVASAHALVASPFKSAYVTSKHGPRTHKDCRPRSCRAWRYLQRHLPRVCSDSSCPEPDSRDREGAGDQ
jgi:3-hydroxybutyrate dehydrogenase